ncbi:MAG TPA: hypothetical protein VGN17_26210 [Bryobacteraceae bacterium]|jgi:hypothetical protein
MSRDNPEHGNAFIEHLFESLSPEQRDSLLTLKRPLIVLVMKTGKVKRRASATELFVEELDRTSELARGLPELRPNEIAAVICDELRKEVLWRAVIQRRSFDATLIN